MKKLLIQRKTLFILIITIAFFLRIYNLNLIPPSLHGDELGIGYNAYSLLTHGIDEYGKSWPLVLRADVPPTIFYATIPSIALFGVNEFAVRFPSVIIGTITIPAFYFLIKELLTQHKNSKQIALISAALLSITPWHIQISRIAHDAPYGLLLQMLALFCFLKGLRQKKYIFFTTAFILFGATFYTYHSPRLTTPFLIGALFIIYLKKLRPYWKILVFGLFLFFLLITPITLDFLTKPLSQTRFGGINIFIRDGSPTFIEHTLTVLSRFIVNYLNQFNPKYLFFDTSTMRYFNVQHVGLLLLVELPLIIFGVIKLWYMKSIRFIVFSWLIIAPLPGALTLGSMNGGRVFMLLPMLCFVAVLGINILTKAVKGFAAKRLVTMVITMLFTINFAFFAYQYFAEGPEKFLQQWQYGAKEIALFANAKEPSYDKIIITDKIKQAYIYILFYGKKDPLWLANLPNKTRHQFIGFSAFGKYEFRSINWEHDKKLKNALIIGLPSEFPQELTKSTIVEKNGEILAVSVSLNQKVDNNLLQ